jgi:hypothetical protein
MVVDQCKSVSLSVGYVSKLGYGVCHTVQSR